VYLAWGDLERIVKVLLMGKGDWESDTRIEVMVNIKTTNED